jgi:hypothetical protein
MSDELGLCISHGCPLDPAACTNPAHLRVFGSGWEERAAEVAANERRLAISDTGEPVRHRATESERP